MRLILWGLEDAKQRRIYIFRWRGYADFRVGQAAYMSPKTVL